MHENVVQSWWHEINFKLLITPAVKDKGTGKRVKDGDSVF